LHGGRIEDPIAIGDLPARIEIELIAASRAETHRCEHSGGGDVHPSHADTEKNDQTQAQNSAHRRAKLHICLPAMLKAL
jgi:hypothetical protein